MEVVTQIAAIKNRVLVERVLLHDDIIRLFIEAPKPPTQIRFRAAPNWLRVTLPRLVTSDGPAFAVTRANGKLVGAAHPEFVQANPGTYRAVLNNGGAVTIVVDGDMGDGDGVRLGVKPGEFSFECPYAVGETTLATREGGAKAWTILARNSLLWVAEAWRAWRDVCDGGDTADDHACGAHCDQTYVSYGATPRQGYRPRPDRQPITYRDASSPIDDARLAGPWLEAEDMPRQFSRLWLQPSSVRLERLGDATALDMRAAGATCSLDDGSPHCTALPCDSLRQRFRHLMDKTIGQGVGEGVTNDLWVWTVECNRLRIAEGATLP